MDHGPVDAGPTGRNEYDDPTRPGSPDQERLEPPRRTEFRSASKRRSLARGQYSVDGSRDPAAASPPPSLESPESLEDPPMFPRVGATAEEVSGEVGTEEEDEHQHHLRPASTDGAGDAEDRRRQYKFTLYETNARYWLTGTGVAEKTHRLLRIDRTSPPGQIALFEDGTAYSLQEINDALAGIDEGNRATGGLRKRYQFWGLLGFIRFTDAYYMVVVTKRQQVAMIGGHFVYRIEGTDLVPLTTGASGRFARDRNAEETRFLGILNNLDLNKSFYFSYSYDVTHSLQTNMIRQRQAMNDGLHHARSDFNGMFVWNHHLLKPAIAALRRPFDWCLPIIHGFIDQAMLDIFGRAVYITIIGRRSRNFAGARFLKRGVNDSGYVANDVETEQIVSEKLTTSFHAPGPRLYSNPTYTSYLHHRGSIPLYWTQDNSGVTPKPDIDLNLQDPFYQPAALHFDHLFERYGCPVYVLNLIKSRERTPRESKLLVEFQKCIEYLNQSLPEGKKIQYKAFDMSRAAKAREGDVIGHLEAIAKDVVETTGFFRNGDEGFDAPQVQNGVARTNCIDCLDRTNTAQFVIGKRAFALQLQALGVIDRDEIDYDTDAVNIFTHMFHDHGDTIAVQYGGSHLVNTMATYRKLNQWQSQSRDMVESFKRYYHNSFLDNQRQEAYNLFLGNYVWSQGQPMLWDLPTDYYLHHSDPRSWLERSRRDYIRWYTPEFLEPRRLPMKPIREPNETSRMGDVGEYDEYWQECYRPAALSTLGKLFSFRMNAANRYPPDRPRTDAKFDYSPFKIRLDAQRYHHQQQQQQQQQQQHPHPVDSLDKPRPRKGVTILDPGDERPHLHIDVSASRARSRSAGDRHSILREPLTAPPRLSGSQQHQQQHQPVEAAAAADKAQTHLWTLGQFHAQSLDPSVSETEAREYARYIAHPLHLPLVVSTDLPSDANLDYIDHVHKAGGSAFDGDDDDDDDVVDHRDPYAHPDARHFWDFVAHRHDPLTVTEEDGAKKRYKAYRKWLRGKSLFKQSQSLDSNA